jgi:hypothetical protein
VYQPTGHEQIVPIEPPLPEADAGVPMPLVAANEHEVAVAYWCAPYEERRVAVVIFRPGHNVLFGSPNDEAFHGHPPYTAGLRYYAFVEVRNSPWIAALERQNRVHRLHDAERFASRRHFILPFHDSTFECIADVAEARLPDAADPAEALARLSLWRD